MPRCTGCAVTDAWLTLVAYGLCLLVACVGLVRGAAAAKRKASGEPTDEVPVKQKKHPRLEEATGEDAKTSSASGAVSTSEADPTTGSAGAAASAAGDDTPAGSADGGKTADTADVGATAGSGSGSQAAVEDKEDAEERERVAQLKKALAAALARKQAIEDGVLGGCLTTQQRHVGDAVCRPFLSLDGACASQARTRSC